MIERFQRISDGKGQRFHQGVRGSIDYGMNAARPIMFSEGEAELTQKTGVQTVVPTVIQHKVTIAGIKY